MSGGFFNYASVDTSDLEDLLTKRRNWVDLRDAFESFGADDVAAEIDAMIQYVMVADRRVTARLNRLHDVAKAMEWWKSCDWSKDRLEEELKKYRGEE